MTKTVMQIVYLSNNKHIPTSVEEVGIVQWRPNDSTLFAPWRDMTFSIADLEKIIKLMKEEGPIKHPYTEADHAGKVRQMMADGV